MNTSNVIGGESHFGTAGKDKYLEVLMIFKIFAE